MHHWFHLIHLIRRKSVILKNKAPNSLVYLQFLLHGIFHILHCGIIPEIFNFGGGFFPVWIFHEIFIVRKLTGRRYHLFISFMNKCPVDHFKHWRKHYVSVRAFHISYWNSFFIKFVLFQILWENDINWYLKSCPYV